MLKRAHTVLLMVSIVGCASEWEGSDRVEGARLAAGSDDGSEPAPGCDPADTACADPCAADSVQAFGDCDALLGYRWNGTDCEALSGCGCSGDCALLHGSAEECKLAHELCGGPPPPIDTCDALAQQLDAALAAARACEPASAAAMSCDGSFVPTRDGCEAPVFSKASEETAKYLELFAVYAESCYLGDPVCVHGSEVTCQETGAGGGVCVASKSDGTKGG